MTATSPHILWVHGWGAAPAVWEPLAGRLGQARHRFVDFRQARSPRDLQEAVVRGIDGPTVIVGWSMGALLAMEAAAGNDAVRGLVLFAGTRQFTAAATAFGWSPRMLLSMRRRLVESPRAVLAEFLPRLFTDHERTAEPGIAFLHRFTADTCGFSPEGLLAGLDYLLQTNTVSASRRLRIPVAWVHGDQDRICPPDAFRATRVDLEPRGHRFEEWAHVGHLPFWFHPQRATAVVNGLLQASKSSGQKAGSQPFQPCGRELRPGHPDPGGDGAKAP